MRLREAVTAEAFEEDLEPQANARVLARFANGEPAMVAKPFGKGKTTLVGSFLALAYQRQTHASTKRLLRALARAAGVVPEVEVSGPGTSEVEVRRLTSDRVQFLFAFNHARTPAQATISLRLPWVAGEVRNVESGRSVPVRVGGAGAVVQKTLAGGEIWVLRFARR